MIEGTDTKNKLRPRKQRQAFYLTQPHTMIREKELPDDIKTVSTYRSTESSSPLPGPGSSFTSTEFSDKTKLVSKVSVLYTEYVKEPGVSLKRSILVYTEKPQRFDDKMEALKEAIVENIQIVIAEPVRETVAKILLDIQSRKDETHKTYKSVCTQTTPESTKGDVLAEIKENVSDTTEPKALYQEPTYVYLESHGNTTIAKPSEQFNEYDNVILRTQSTSAFCSYSLQIRDQRVPVNKPRPKSAIEVKRGACDERECLANALQFHIEDLVDGIVFHESELPDCLLAEGCLTEDECASVRKLRDRKDQIRVLLSLIKGRDLRVLRGFVKHIEQHNEDVAAKIIDKFEDNKREGIRRKLCFLCQLEKQFNVKHVVDSLWAIQVIDDGLYNTIIYSEAPIGAQETLWKKVIHSLNSLDLQTAKSAHDKLLKALTSKNLFTHLADGIQNMLIQNHGKLTCSCEPRLILPRRNSFFTGSISEESVLPDSSSDGTSTDLASSCGTYNRTIPFLRYGGTFDRLARITEDPLSPSRIIQGVDSPFDDMIPRTLREETSQTFQKYPVTDGVQDRANRTTLDAEQPTPRLKPVVPKKPVRSQMSPECAK